MTADRHSLHVFSPDAVDLNRMALLLDVDGTLLDIAPRPTDVTVPPALRPILADLIERSGGAVALVSGRTIKTLDRLFSPLTLPAIGGHGAEIRLSAGGPILRTPAGLSASLRHELHLLARADPHVLVEDKRHSIALHYRQAPQQEAFLKGGVRKIVLNETDVEFLCGKFVIDIKPRLFSKGSAVLKLMAERPFTGRVPLFVGDDTTDESVFAILPNLEGRGYSVGKQIAGAQGTFRSPQDVRSWLETVWGQGAKAT
ncbi:MAG TPA: trehalose-phosphatase [Methyloceanibacter sp.]|jgi:trehalose 6-phosphate phosphatase|nr:trehalose-phosphatase [Methyloceanibacter sp.]